MIGDGQVDKVMASGRGRRGFESSHRHSTSPLGSPLFGATPFLKIDVHGCLTNKMRYKIKAVLRLHFVKGFANNVKVVYRSRSKNDRHPPEWSSSMRSEIAASDLSINLGRRYRRRLRNKWQWNRQDIWEHQLSALGTEYTASIQTLHPDFLSLVMISRFWHSAPYSFAYKAVCI